MPDDVSRVRLVLMRELETINDYEELARQAESPDVRAFFLHLAQEEKEHVAEATFLIRKLDAGQEQQFQKDFQGGAHFGGASGARAAPGGAAAPAASVSQPAPPTFELGAIPADPRSVLHAIPAAPSANASPLTVGSLKRSRSSPLPKNER